MRPCKETTIEVVSKPVSVDDEEEERAIMKRLSQVFSEAKRLYAENKHKGDHVIEACMTGCIEKIDQIEIRQDLKWCKVTRKKIITEIDNKFT